MKTITGSARGICTTCNHRDSCSHRLTSDQPVWRCEEFDDVVAEAVAVANGLFPPDPIPVDLAMGLCLNCDFRPVCRNARLGGGVWHCEEYA